MITARRHNYLFNPMEKEIIAAITKVNEAYGKPAAIKVEALFRNETRHFKSGNYAATFSPGMEAVKKPDGSALPYPYGWTSLREFWDQNPQYKPTGIHLQVENDSGQAKSRGERAFIKFPSVEAAFMTVAKRLQMKGWDTGAWFADANHPDKQASYRDYITKIKTPYANAL